MKSKEYWKQRAERDLAAAEKQALEYEKDLRKAYERAMAKIEKEINSFYGKYAKDLGISYAEARRMLDRSELKSFRQAAKEYYEMSIEQGLDIDYQKALKGLSGKAYISRLDEIILNIRHQLELLNKEKTDKMGSTLEKVYEDTYNHTAYAIETGMGVQVSFTRLDTNAIQTAVKQKWLGENYSDRCWNDKTRLLSTLNQVIPQSFIRGLNSRELAKVVQKEMNTSFYRAQRLVRTEVNHIANQASLKMYQDSGLVDRYEYLATLDMRTSEICAEMDGQVFDLKDAQVGVNLPPLHPHCRSTTIPYFEDNEITQRVARNEEGKSQFLNSNPTYAEWKKWKEIESTPESSAPKEASTPPVPVEMTEDLKNVIRRYTTGNYKTYNEQADMYLSGTPREKAFSSSGELLFKAVNSSTETFDELYRIERVEGFKVQDGVVVQSPFKKGQELTWGLRSTSKSPKFISKAAAGKDKNLPFVGGSRLEDSVVYRLRNQNGLDISKISPYNQSEVIVSGKYVVTGTGSVEDVGGRKVIVVDVEDLKKKKKK